MHVSLMCGFIVIDGCHCVTTSVDYALVNGFVFTLCHHNYFGLLHGKFLFYLFQFLQLQVKLMCV